MNPLRRLVSKRQLDRDLAAEMAEHLEEKVEQLIAEGHSPEKARTLARKQFGNLTLQQEASRAEWGFNAAEQLWQDTRFALRILRKTPAFTATAILVLALGIGLNTAMFSAIKAVLLTGLPYPEPERIVNLAQSDKEGHLIDASMPDFRDWRAQSATIEYMAVYGSGSVTASGDFRARNVRIANAGSNFFDVIATHALIGRTFSAAEQKPGAPPTIVLGYELAAQLFGTPAAALEKTIHLNGMSFAVIGVMPPKFDFPDGAQLWIPNDLFPDDSDRSAHNYLVLGRLKPGVTVQQAQADMNVVAARLAATYADDKERGIRVTSLYDSLTGGIRPALYILWSAVTLVLLIACVNISNLQLARAAARRKEMGMRAALGAGRGRLLGQLLTENILLAIAGGALGLAIAKIAVKLLRVSAPAGIPRIENLSIDTGVLLFTAALSLLAGFLFGMLPSFDSSRTDVNHALKQTTGKGSDPEHRRWGRVLVAGQIALAMLLLSSAALLIRSYWQLAHVPTGFDTRNVYLTSVTWPMAPGGNSVDAAFVQRVGTQILSQVEQLPGVTGAALVHNMPFGFAPDGGFEIEGRPLPADPHKVPYAYYRMATPDYFKLFGIPILRGRGFTTADDRSNQQVAIANQTFLRTYFPAGDVLGKRIRFLGFDRKPQFMTIVGIIPDLRPSFRSAPGPEVYTDVFQHADALMDANLLIRGPATLQPKIEQIITSLNHVTAVNFETMDHVISSTVSRERFETVLLAVFAASALLLAVVGIYGLLSYMVTRRSSEMGVRIALGASRARIVQLILREAGLLTIAGIALGLLGSLLAARVLQSLLHQIKATDPATLFIAVIAFGLAAFVAAYLPAHRAAQIDPSEALRSE
ncbi:MAG TPA: ABC transporter permease [Bryobacteraceae bacterium]|jgi:putative ABC transport system permease protein|nr:ABC transporter permease [Bryobacteraceae bacterium]